MQRHTVSLQATDAFLGVRLNALLFSLISLGIYAVVVASLVHFTLLHDDPLIAVVGCGILVFLLFALVLFINLELLGNSSVPAGRTNLAEYLSGDMVRALAKESGSLQAHLLAAAAKTPRGEFFLRSMGIESREFLRQFAVEANDAVEVAPFLLRAVDLARHLGEPRVDGNVIIAIFLQTDDDASRVLNALDISEEDVWRMLQWERFHNQWELAERHWHPRKLLRAMGTIGRTWVLGYTYELDAFTTDVSEEVRYAQDDIVLHQRALEDLLHILARSQRKNALVLGRTGVGKHRLVRNLAKLMRRHEVEHSLPFTRVVLLHTEQLLAGSERPEALLLSALTRADRAGRFLLIVDNLPFILKAQRREVIAVLTKFLQSPRISLIGIADPEEYHVLVKRDPMLDQLFEKVALDDVTDDETTAVLMSRAFQATAKTDVTVTYRAIKLMLELAKRYVAREALPGKALAVMSDAIGLAEQRGSPVVAEEDVRKAVSLKAHMDVTAVSKDEREKLLKLESELRRSIVGQDEALSALANALKRARMDLQDRRRPLGTFLFLGPTGVGKTQTAKVLAQEYFGSEDAMIRLDMNEYSTEDSVRLLIGSPDAGESSAEGFLAKRVQDRPFSLVLLDEIEKAHPKVLNLFLQILDEGQLIDSFGMKTDFRNTIIIATSNAGALFVREYVKAHAQDIQHSAFKRVLVDTILKEKVFSPEFLNRFDEVILYRPLSLVDAKRVGLLMLDSVVAELSEHRGIKLRIEESVVDTLVERGYSSEFGAREMRRAIVVAVENILADILLKRDVKRGDEIVIRREDLSP